ncbi:hypothetical protein GOHSU_19_00200 [Gordonia hirsuta DSM 44140 = NBRC 16056]|uniref:Lipoprotein n=1 Tax=Gordonia hirsuta DSM 44140 = NBRC 16056 TaxID=1121927 RepID=L7L8E1_9ACTN|nr:hypothetical protein [Gordonia hirsuta]GAC57415.1 hypothetical protein GOHSU_19_00200 [Gordonia hirsuta DSM 44140 = NBRC 16056]
MRRRHLATAATAAAALLLTGCGESADTPPHAADRPATSAPIPVPPAPAVPHDLAACAATPPTGPIVRTGYGLDYPKGSIHIAVTPFDGTPPLCVEFTKSGPADPQVPPDTLLFTFAGPHGEGAQIEFDSVALTGGLLPALGNGFIPRVGPLDHPLDARVGAAIGGTYYAAAGCSLLLTQVTATGAGGRFECPAAAPAPNQFAPSDDVDYELDDTVPRPAGAALSGWFELRR